MNGESAEKIIGAEDESTVTPVPERVLLYLLHFPPHGLLFASAAYLLHAVEKAEDAMSNRHQVHVLAWPHQTRRCSSAASRRRRTQQRAEPPPRRTLGSWSLTRKRRSPTTCSCRSSRVWSPSRSRLVKQNCPISSLFNLLVKQETITRNTFYTHEVSLSL
jgi:hypothetical protein